MVASASNDGSGGLQTSSEPAISASVMSIGSIDNSYYLYARNSFLITPNGTNIVYWPATLYGKWRSIVQSKIVVNNEFATIDDGCSGPMKSVFGSVVLFTMSSNDSCNSTVRCDLAAMQGATGCLFSNTEEYAGDND